ncbi:MAG: 4-hydroxy-2-oxopentanoic acid aldolase [Gammaproteobacteria bacterium]|nr:4-hydroxy-2-oxopentanoic acid aldolase [Gammaproteobacteria bacterium]HJP17164.1 4-hydroxy-2-oxovalerate aldolase [Nitrospinota bacterium]
MEKVIIIDTTLRDGSYAVNFSFSMTDTSIICRELESAGFEYIEIGHGVGMNASNRGYGVAAHTDEEYMIAAESVLKKAKYGMFCIPGIAELKNIDIAAKHNIGFLRIGTDIDKVASSEPFIKKAKDYGMLVSSNFMKSYSFSPEEFAKKVKLSEQYGADIIYIVDSAGGMFPEQIKEYYKVIREISDIPLGFHGHDNLGLAIANSLVAIDAGIDYIDSSLQGLGRSSGNASTEILLATFLKKGYATNIDFLKVLEIGQKYIQPLINVTGKVPLDIVSGFADFHSSFMHHIQKFAAKYSVDPAVLMIEYTKVNKVNMEEDVLESIAQKMSGKENIYLGKYNFSRYIGKEQDGTKS